MQKALDLLLIKDHIGDLDLMKACCRAVYLFIIARLALGIFGMDLYEIYWWFSAGLTVALFNMNKYTEIKTKKLLQSNTF